MRWILLAIICGIEIREESCQVNFGTLSLTRNPTGDLQIGLNQMANIFGFGGDRGLQLTTGNGKFDIKSNQGALIGGERLGVDSGIGIQEQQGLNLGSVLNFGNQPTESGEPTGQLGSFINNIGKFFQSFGKQTTAPIPSSLSQQQKAALPASVGRTETSSDFISSSAQGVFAEKADELAGANSFTHSSITTEDHERPDQERHLEAFHSTLTSV